MKEICCGNCKRPTRHLLSTVQQMCAHLPESAMETEQINYACPECKHLGHAWIPGASISVELQNPTAHPDGTVSFLIAIECAEKNCQSRIAVFAPMKHGTDSLQARGRLQGWIDDGEIRCAKGYPPMKP